PHEVPGGSDRLRRRHLQGLLAAGTPDLGTCFFFRGTEHLLTPRTSKMDGHVVHPDTCSRRTVPSLATAASATTARLLVRSHVPSAGRAAVPRSAILPSSGEGVIVVGPTPRRTGEHLPPRHEHRR